MLWIAIANVNVWELQLNSTLGIRGCHAATYFKLYILMKHIAKMYYFNGTKFVLFYYKIR